MIRVFVAEDHELVREGIKKIARTGTDIDVVGEAGNLADSLEFLSRTEVDVVLLDLSLPDNEGIDGVLRIRARFPAVSILVLSIHPEERYALRALQAGAAGYVTKAMAAEEVIKALRKIAAGERFISTRVTELLVDGFLGEHDSLPSKELSRRETEVVQLLSAGLQVKQIAARLGVSVSSVNTYRARIFRKTGLKTDTALVRFAIQNGLIE